MNQLKVIRFPITHKKNSKKRKRKTLNARKKGRVYVRGGKLWVDFYYLGERAREPSGLDDNQINRAFLRKQLDLIMAEIENGIFDYAKRFPHSKKKNYFSLRAGKTPRKDPNEIIFNDYVKRWWEEMKPGMTENQTRDYQSIIKNHLNPFFGRLSFSAFKPVLMKKFIAQLMGKRNRYGNPLSGKTIRTYLIPLRTIVRDAMEEFEWDTVKDPFRRLKLPQVKRVRVQPFSYAEWSLILEHMLPWYKPYFEFAVQTGLRPSEQVALKWLAVDEPFIHIELSRVRKREKTELKTQGSVRRIELRPQMIKTLERQRRLTKGYGQPYVFLNSKGGPIQQENLSSKIWRPAMEKSGVRYRRMYEIRHTFASWALAAGESPGWVARTLGHVDTSMVFKTYGCYIPNLTRKDGSAFERNYVVAQTNCAQKVTKIGTIMGTIQKFNPT